MIVYRCYSMTLSSKLEELNLSGNQLTELPSDMQNLKQLTALHLHANKLTDLPDLSSLENLKVSFHLLPPYPLDLNTY